LMLASIVVCIVLLFKVFTFVQNTQDRLSDLQQKTESTLNVRDQLCDSDSIRGFLEDRSRLCTQ
jgi:hypothetical protein